MKKWITIWPLFVMLLSSFGNGENKWSIRGDRHFEKMEFHEAAFAYEKAIEEKENLILCVKLARCFIKLNEPEKIVSWYKRASKLGLINSDDKLQFAFALTRLEKYDEAIYWFEIYGREKPGDSRVNRYLKAINNLKSFFANQSNFKVYNLSINSKSREFSPMFYKEGFLFVSGRRRRTFSEMTYLWDDTPFLDLYYCNRSTDEVVNFSKDFNTKYHEGPLAFDHQNGHMFFTRNNYMSGKLKMDDNGVTRLKVYQSVFRDNEWKKAKELPFNDDNYSTGHPTLDDSGNTMIFASDRPDGYGGTDLYVTHKNENGDWGTPENLGPIINTEGNEMFPFMHVDGSLYYASDGQGGLGGLDIFAAGFDHERRVVWNRNLGSPINTSYDDFGLVVNQQKTAGYFASNRKGGKGLDDIYELQFLNAGQMMSGVVIDKITKKPLADSRIRIMENDIEVNYVLTDENGFFSLAINPEKNYRLITKKLEYLTNKFHVDFPNDQKEKPKLLTIEMEKADLILNAKTLEKNSYHPIQKDINISLLNETSGIKQQLTADEDGEVELKLQPKSTYFLKVEKEDYFTLSRRFSTDGDSEPKQFDFELPMEEIVMDKPIRINNIYYDYDQWFIRKDALPELDNIFQLLIDNPSLKVELSSHTDSRGDVDYNHDLSQKRAESVVNYFVSRGIAQERLKARGYGEDKLLNYCTGFVSCSEEDHQTNRRTEFKVIGRIKTF